jgi:hypothetical protein
LLVHVVAGVEAGDRFRKRAVASGVAGDAGEQVDERPEPVGFGVEQPWARVLARTCAPAGWRSLW